MENIGQNHNAKEQMPVTSLQKIHNSISIIPLFHQLLNQTIEIQRNQVKLPLTLYSTDTHFDTSATDTF